MWNQVGLLLKKVWRPLTGSVLTTAAVCILLAMQTAGVIRGLILGVSLTTLVLATVGFVFVLSGSSSLLSSAMTEATTATDLNRLKRSGWHVVHGFKLKVKNDIDHIAIGPGGVLVVETKWSAEEWPSNRSASTYLATRIEDGIAQTERAVTRVLGTFGEVTKRRGVTRGVLVLNAPRAVTSWEPYTVRSTTILRAGSLGDWLNALPDDLLSPPEIRQLAQAVAAKDAELVQREAALGTTVPPTLNQLINRWAIAAPLSAAITALALLELGVVGGFWGCGAGLLASGALIWRGWRTRPWRPVLIGVGLGNTAVLGLIIGAIARSAGT